MNIMKGVKVGWLESGLICEEGMLLSLTYPFVSIHAFEPLKGPLTFSHPQLWCSNIGLGSRYQNKSLPHCHPKQGPDNKLILPKVLLADERTNGDCAANTG